MMKIQKKSYTDKEWKVLNQKFTGWELCPECNYESYYEVNPTKKICFKCEHCGIETLPCSLCDTYLVGCCGGGEGCCDSIAKSLIAWNEEQEGV